MPFFGIAQKVQLTYPRYRNYYAAYALAPGADLVVLQHLTGDPFYMSRFIISNINSTYVFYGCLYSTFGTFCYFSVAPKFWLNLVFEPGGLYGGSGSYDLWLKNMGSYTCSIYTTAIYRRKSDIY